MSATDLQHLRYRHHMFQAFIVICRGDTFCCQNSAHPMPTKATLKSPSMSGAINPSELHTVQHRGSHVAWANIHNMLDVRHECVPSRVLNLI